MDNVLNCLQIAKWKISVIFNKKTNILINMYSMKENRGEATYWPRFCTKSLIPEVEEMVRFNNGVEFIYRNVQ